MDLKPNVKREIGPCMLGEGIDIPEPPTVSLVTGGAGFIGSHLVRILLNEGQRVVVYDNLSTGSTDKLNLDHPNLLFIQADILNLQKLRQVFSTFRPMSIWHMAALHFIPYCNEHPAETIRVNVVGTQCVLECCDEFDVDELIYTSTAAVYPIADQACSEDGPVGPNDVYGITKLTAEMLITHFQQTTKVRCIIARLFNVYGPGETNAHVIPEIVDQACKRQTIQIGNTLPKRDFIHIEDVISALLSLRQARWIEYGIFNVGTGIERSVEEILGFVEQILEEPLNIEVDPERVRKVDRLHLKADISRIRQEIGWNPSFTMQEGLAQLMQK